MQPIRNAQTLPLFWSQPKTMARSFSLHGDGQEYARLEFQSAFGSHALAQTAAHTWSFKRVGFFNPRITVRRPNEDLDLAVYQPRWTGTEGLLTLSGGRTFQWRAANFWGTKFAFLDSQGSTVVTFKEGSQEGRLSDLFKTQAMLELEPDFRDLPELDLLSTLGWYLLVLYHEDAASAAAVVATT